MKAGVTRLGNQDDAGPEKPETWNNGSQSMPTLSLLGFCFEPPKGADDQATVAVPVCAACRKPFTDGERRHNHHVSYSQNWTVPVHLSCHNYIHNSDRYPHLKPSDNDLNKYRGKKREQNRKYRHDNPDKISENDRKYYQTNKDKIRQYRQANCDKISEYQRQYRQAKKDKIRQYRQANLDKIRERESRYRQANLDKISERKRQYRLANIDKVREGESQYSQANRNKINERKRQYRLANIDKVREQDRQHHLRNRDKINEQARQRRQDNKAKTETKQVGISVPKLLGSFIPKIMCVAAFGKKPKGSVA